MCLQCLLDQLLLSRDEEGKGMSKAALRDELMTLLVAGQETSAILLGWTCAFLAQHSEAQRRAADEAKAVNPCSFAPTYCSKRCWWPGGRRLPYA